jgi:CheY-like chemotaxis protein
MNRTAPVVAVSGSPAPAVEVIRQLLAARGFAMVDAESGTGEHLGAAVLVEPSPEHWYAALGCDVPIVLLLARPPQDDEVLDAVLAGADAVLSCDCPPDLLVEVVAAVVSGATVLAPHHVRALARFARDAALHHPVVLTPRETEILAWIAAGEGVK